MRRFVLGLAAAAWAASVPAGVWAGDRETAQQIAAALRDSGRLVDYSIGVKYSEGTAWLKGRVANEDQMYEALSMAEEMPEVSTVVNDLKIQATRAAEEREEVRPTSARLTSAHRAVTEEASEEAVDEEGLAESEGLESPDNSVDSRYEEEAVEEAQPVRRAPPLARKKSPLRRTSAATPAKSMNRETRTPVGRPVGMTRVDSRAPVTLEEAPPAMSSGAPLGTPIPAYAGAGGVAPARYDHPHLPGYAWPSYAAYPNYGAVTYPKQYSASAWPYIGPFYPYPQVPLGWRKVTLEWDDGWWFLDFDARKRH
jgi:BON domain